MAYSNQNGAESTSIPPLPAAAWLGTSAGHVQRFVEHLQQAQSQMFQQMSRDTHVASQEASQATRVPDLVGLQMVYVAEELTRLLYQGILLRDPDPGAQGAIDSIRTGGYDALVKVAVGIAGSEESRVRLGATPVEQRLASLYQILLGIDRSQADPQQWQADLNLMNQGRFADVVSGIVQSDRFRQRHNLVGVRY